MSSTSIINSQSDPTTTTLALTTAQPSTDSPTSTDLRTTPKQPAPNSPPSTTTQPTQLPSADPDLAFEYPSNLEQDVQELFSYAVLGDVNSLESLFKRSQIHPDTQDASGHTPLLLASRYGHVETMRCLIQEGANPLHSTQNGNSAVMLAAAAGQINSLRFLFEEVVPALLPSDLQTLLINKNFDSVLMFALMAGQMVCAQYLIYLAICAGVLGLENSHYVLFPQQAITSEILHESEINSKNNAKNALTQKGKKKSSGGAKGAKDGGQSVSFDLQYGSYLDEDLVLHPLSLFFLNGDGLTPLMCACECEEMSLVDLVARAVQFIVDGKGPGQVHELIDMATVFGDDWEQVQAATIHQNVDNSDQSKDSQSVQPDSSPVEQKNDGAPQPHPSEETSKSPNTPQHILSSPLCNGNELDRLWLLHHLIHIFLDDSYGDEMDEDQISNRYNTSLPPPPFSTSSPSLTAHLPRGTKNLHIKKYINRRDINGNTALHIASRDLYSTQNLQSQVRTFTHTGTVTNGHLSMDQIRHIIQENEKISILLVQLGADFGLQNHCYETPYGLIMRQFAMFNPRALTRPLPQHVFSTPMVKSGRNNQKARQLNQPDFGSYINWNLNSVPELVRTLHQMNEKRNSDDKPKSMKKSTTSTTSAVQKGEGTAVSNANGQGDPEEIKEQTPTCPTTESGAEPEPNPAPTTEESPNIENDKQTADKCDLDTKPSQTCEKTGNIEPPLDKAQKSGEKCAATAATTEKAPTQAKKEVKKKPQPAAFIPVPIPDSDSEDNGDDVLAATGGEDVGKKAPPANVIIPGAITIGSLQPEVEDDGQGWILAGKKNKRDHQPQINKHTDKTEKAEKQQQEKVTRGDKIDKNSAKHGHKGDKIADKAETQQRDSKSTDNSTQISAPQPVPPTTPLTTSTSTSTAPLAGKSGWNVDTTQTAPSSPPQQLVSAEKNLSTTDKAEKGTKSHPKLNNTSETAAAAAAAQDLLSVSPHDDDFTVPSVSADLDSLEDIATITQKAQTTVPRMVYAVNSNSYPLQSASTQRPPIQSSSSALERINGTQHPRKLTQLVHDEFPRAADLAIGSAHILGQGLQTLSSEQLDCVEEVLNDLLTRTREEKRWRSEMEKVELSNQVAAGDIMIAGLKEKLQKYEAIFQQQRQQSLSDAEVKTLLSLQNPPAESNDTLSGTLAGNTVTFPSQWDRPMASVENAEKMASLHRAAPNPLGSPSLPTSRYQQQLYAQPQPQTMALLQQQQQQQQHISQQQQQYPSSSTKASINAVVSMNSNLGYVFPPPNSASSPSDDNFYHNLPQINTLNAYYPSTASTNSNPLAFDPSFASYAQFPQAPQTAPMGSHLGLPPGLPFYPQSMIGVYGMPTNSMYAQSVPQQHQQPLAASNPHQTSQPSSTNASNLPTQHSQQIPQPPQTNNTTNPVTTLTPKKGRKGTQFPYFRVLSGSTTPKKHSKSNKFGPSRKNNNNTVEADIQRSAATYPRPTDGWTMVPIKRSKRESKR